MKKRISLPILLAFVCLQFQSAYAQVSGSKASLYMYFHKSGPNGLLSTEQGDTIGEINWKALSEAPGTIRTGASIRSFVTGPVSANWLPANLVFRTGPGILQDRMVITAEGLVGVGTMTPGFNLDVNGNTHTSGDFFGRIHFDDNQSTDDAPDTYIDEAYFELKQRNVLGLPAGPGAHGGLLSLAPGASSFDHQLFFGEDGIYTRRFNGNANSWAGANWYKLLTGEDINGTPNRIAKFTAPNSLGDSQLFDDGTQVGIGTVTPDPAALLTINGNTRNLGDMRVDGNTTLNQGLSVQGNIAGGQNITAAQNITAQQNITADANATIGNNLSVGNNATVLQRMSVGTATMANGYALSVRGGIITDEVLVELPGAWPDYVFAPDYELTPLSEVAAFVENNRHLPGIAPAAEIEAKGLDLGASQKQQMEKIENIYLYLIEMDQRIKTLEAENAALQSRLPKQ
ncbi:MAG: hypothetical protein IPL65_12720 [Lewinellaceae bacterium]|nr:hypothetical protein [Lewinellaceae bacterium]